MLVDALQSNLDLKVSKLLVKWFEMQIDFQNGSFAPVDVKK